MVPLVCSATCSVTNERLLVVFLFKYPNVTLRYCCVGIFRLKISKGFCCVVYCSVNPDRVFTIIEKEGKSKCIHEEKIIVRD